MLSKISVFDYFNKYREGLPKLDKGIYSIIVDDPYIESFIRKKIPKDKCHYRLLVGKELTKSSVEDLFLNLSFFQSNEPTIVINAQEVSEDVLVFLNDVNSPDSLLVLFFNKLSKNQSNIINKSEGIVSIEVQAPKFWEGAKLLSFILEMYELKISSEARNYILQNIENSIESFCSIISKIKLDVDNDDQIDIEYLKKKIVKDRFDFFELIEKYHSNNKIFFQELLLRERDYEWFVGFLVFFQGHLIKVLNPEVLIAKDKLNKYEQNIINWSESGSRENFLNDLKFLNKLEIEFKKKNLFALDQIRLRIL
jgi:hypothetical protein